jgi:hypothetical protein
MIKIITEKRYHKGLPDISYPIFVCDVCGEQIADCEEAFCFWGDDLSVCCEDNYDHYEKKHEPYMYHKKCYIKNNKPNRTKSWIELKNFIQYLGISCGFYNNIKKSKSFTSFIKQYKKEESDFGNLARDIVKNENYKLFNNRKTGLIYLKEINACSNVIDTYERAWNVYSFEFK